ncbi:MAG: 4-(cytidine 5'-diphospho)-2-C-methyl-D-erythritol kinase [Treponema sp.]|jgi:4-diphosphocytidyl-2-C-methyl-D-erythritol kinase|nr:4-(cytidine 5'-diphospho)-2-C-methyl-D-erythritol kinase [Treponema sp.]
MIQSLTRESYTCKAPGKINLHLLVGERRPDGFHSLESVFAALDFADTLVFSFSGEAGKTVLSMKAEEPLPELVRRGRVFEPIPAEKNLVYRAVELFRQKTGFSRALGVEVTKRIPPGSGLGGGSSDAAAVLLVLNGLAASSGTGSLSAEALLDAAAELGSDVPFFVHAAQGRTACEITGRGECIKPLPPPPPLGVLLAFPGFGTHTGGAYGLLDAARRENPPGASPRPRVSLNGSWPPPETWDFSNDFLGLFLDRGAEGEKVLYRKMLADLQRAGASFTGLSGSGSACFGIFDTPERALAAKKGLPETPYTLHATFFLAS